SAEHYFKVERIDIAEDLVGISGMAKGSDAIGLCARKGGKFRIYIKRSILTSLGQAVHTILHEQVHGVSGTNDLTPEYEHALLGVAIKMMHI
ncbi:MAG: hypothetical protein KKF27_21220, partial [Gammaproteobacteria bacterium]|nr:hypothetical protein [Gammaproteobacteria bacterium]